MTLNKLKLYILLLTVFHFLSISIYAANKIKVTSNISNNLNIEEIEKKFNKKIKNSSNHNIDIIIYSYNSKKEIYSLNTKNELIKNVLNNEIKILLKISQNNKILKIKFIQDSGKNFELILNSLANKINSILKSF